MTEAYQDGVSIFMPKEPWTKIVRCEACQAVMRGRWSEGPTSTVEAMAQGKHRHYKYTCPQVGQEGHRHLVDLYLEMDKIKSGGLRNIVMADLVKYRQEFNKKLEEK